MLQAERIFIEILRNEPYHMEGMEIYSTVLWHLQKEVELSSLAHELTEMDKSSAEVNTTILNLLTAFGDI